MPMRGLLRLRLPESLPPLVELAVTSVGLVVYREPPLFATQLDILQVGVLRRILAPEVS
jgi:hypothetical protein